MKASRLNINILLVLIAIFSVPILAEAGIFGDAKDFIFETMIGTILAIGFGIISTFYGATKIGKIIMKSRVGIEGLWEVLNMIRKAKMADSPGGKAVTEKERKEIWKELEETVVKTIKAVTGKKIV